MGPKCTTHQKSLKDGLHLIFRGPKTNSGMQLLKDMKSATGFRIQRASMKQISLFWTLIFANQY